MCDTTFVLSSEEKESGMNFNVNNVKGAMHVLNFRFECTFASINRSENFSSLSPVKE